MSGKLFRKLKDLEPPEKMVPYKWDDLLTARSEGSEELPVAECY